MRLAAPLGNADMPALTAPDTRARDADFAGSRCGLTRWVRGKTRPVCIPSESLPVRWAWRPSATATSVPTATPPYGTTPEADGGRRVPASRASAPAAAQECAHDLTRAPPQKASAQRRAAVRFPASLGRLLCLALAAALGLRSGRPIILWARHDGCRAAGRPPTFFVSSPPAAPIITAPDALLISAPNG
jgi:hypothetical protein